MIVLDYQLILLNIEMIRRANSMNDATNPSDAIDDALKSFNKIEEKD